ncbi:hypothetical protein TNCV_1311491 [Trichonephila clavipes]|nr:hypothetical protein TNCV_1311491 [Trichonephila clavipes]
MPKDIAYQVHPVVLMVCPAGWLMEETKIRRMEPELLVCSDLMEVLKSECTVYMNGCWWLDGCLQVIRPFRGPKSTQLYTYPIPGIANQWHACH